MRTAPRRPAVPHNRKNPGKDALAALYAQHHNWRTVARLLGVTHVVVCHWRRAFGLRTMSRTEYWTRHPERHPNRRMQNVSAPQRRLYEAIRAHRPDALLEWPVPDSPYCADIAIPDLRLVIEYDEPYWHDAERDARRDADLAVLGWRVVRLASETPPPDLLAALDKATPRRLLRAPD